MAGRGCAGVLQHEVPRPQEEDRTDTSVARESALAEEVGVEGKSVVLDEKKEKEETTLKRSCWLAMSHCWLAGERGFCEVLGGRLGEGGCAVVNADKGGRPAKIHLDQRTNQSV
ncbi:MAG: hypothetical protein WCD57_01490 [Acidobacteriaceae bacterium]